MKEAVRIIVPMVLVAVISAGLISLAYGFTKPYIDEKEKLMTDSMLKEIFPEMGSYTKEDNGYVILKEGQTIGKAVISTRFGYSSEIKMLVGLDNNDTVMGVRVIFQEETPGLGSRIAEPGFYSQFEGLKEEDIKLKKDGGKIDAVTSATISSTAAVEAVRDAAGQN